MSFAQGFEQSNATQRIIAFWTHAIDRMLMSSEIVPDASYEGDELHIPFNVMVKTGSTTVDQYFGAVRSGFHMVIQSLPSDVRPVIEDYLQARMIKSRNRLPEEVVDADIIFGTGEPIA